MRIATVLTLTLAGWSIAAGAEAPVPAPASIIERFLQREDVPLTSYRSIRRLEASNQRFKANGWLEAETELTPAGQFQWRVVAEGGSAHVRSRVLRKALEGEADMIRGGMAARGALTDENYAFVAAEVQDDAWARVRIQPRRPDMLLIDGHITLHRHTGDLLEVEGRLAKNPSFWTKRVDVVRRYARINDVRVPFEMVSTAQVRIAGESRFRMIYEYLEINGARVTAFSGSRR